MAETDSVVEIAFRAAMVRTARHRRRGNMAVETRIRSVDRYQERATSAKLYVLRADCQVVR